MSEVNYIDILDRKQLW